MREDQRFTVEVADGRSVTVQAPDANAAAKAAAMWANENPRGMTGEERGRMLGSVTSGLIEQLPGGRMATAGPRAFELQDELTGLAASAYGALTGRETDARAAADFSRADTALYRQRYPLRSTAEEMFATGAVPSRAGRELVEGAVLGGITGAASGTNAENRATYGVLGGALGGALGGIAKTANPIIASVGSMARQMGLSRRGSAAGRAVFSPEEGDAFEALAEAFRADGMGPDTVINFSQAASGDDKTALMDMIRPGGAVEELLRLSAVQTSDANVQLTDRLMRLTDESVQNVQEAIRSNIGSGRVRPTLEALEEARKQASEPLYEAFRNQRPVTAARFNEEGFGNSPTFVRAFEDAIESALDSNDQEVATQLNRALTTGGRDRRGNPNLRINPDASLSPELLNRVKMQLDRRIGQLLDGANPDRARAREIISLRDRYVQTLDRIYPDTYAAARAAYAGSSANITALRRGRELFKTDIEELQELVKNMGESEYEAFRIGASRALTDRVTSAQEGTPNAAGRLLTGDAQERARLLFRGQEENAEEFLNQLRRQRDRIRAVRRSTPARGGANEEIPSPTQVASSAVFEGLNFQPGSVLRTIITETRRGLQSESTNARNTAIARIASSINQLEPNAQEVVFRQLNQEFGEDVARQMRGAVNRVVRGLGVQTAQREDQLSAARVRNMNLDAL